MLLGWAFIGWCVYGGIYLPAQYGSYGREVEEEHARKFGESRLGKPSVGEPSVGEDDVGESLSDEE
jgi:hypothetical protein